MIFINSNSPRKKPRGDRSLTLDQFILKAREKHDNQYTYDKVIYRGRRSKIIITCSIHGDFEQKAGNHLNGCGCPKCYRLQKSQQMLKTTETFIEDSRRVYGDMFQYDHTEYRNNKSKVIITCKIHGNFEQEASYHLKGNGCPECSHERVARTRYSSKQEAEWLSSLDIVQLIRGFHIYSKTHSRRFVVDGLDPITNTVYLYHGDYWHGNPQKFDRSMINALIGKTMGELYDSTIAYEQQLRDLGYNVVTIWESEWKKICKNH